MVAQEYEVSFFEMSYHEYRNTWTSVFEEVLQCRMEPDNDVDKYAVSVMNKDRLDWHLTLSRPEDTGVP